LTIEFLDFEAMFERITVPFTENLKKIGVDASWRLVDPSQYERRVKSFDFDVATQRYSLRLTPGIEMRSFWGSEAAKTDGSFNLLAYLTPRSTPLSIKLSQPSHGPSLSRRRDP